MIPARSDSAIAKIERRITKNSYPAKTTNGFRHRWSLSNPPRNLIAMTPVPAAAGRNTSDAAARRTGNSQVKKQGGARDPPCCRVTCNHLGLNSLRCVSSRTEQRAGEIVVSFAHYAVAACVETAVGVFPCVAKAITKGPRSLILRAFALR